MTEDEAYGVLAPLVVAFNFTEARTYQWRDLLMGLQQVVPAQMAAADLIRDATDTYVPGWGRFQSGYDRFINQARMAAEEERRALEQRTTSYPSVADGIEIARKAYIAECERQGRAPTEGFFEDMIDPVARQARQDKQRHREGR